MPGADVVAVEALGRESGRCSEVLEISKPFAGGIAVGPARREVFVVADRGVGDPLHPTPARVVRLHESLVPAAVVLVVTEREDRREAAVHEHVGRLHRVA